MTKKPVSLALLLLVPVIAATLVWWGQSTPAQSIEPPLTLLDERRPTMPMVDDQSAVELGLRFSTTAHGVITALRFYKGDPLAGSEHTGTLWNEAGAVVAEVTSTNESDVGWQVATLSRPVAAAPGDSFTASFHFPSGHYPVTHNAYPESIDAGWATLPIDAGVYRYGTDRAVPRSSYMSSKYFVDVEFRPSSPVITGAAPEIAQADDPQAVELGMRFTPNVDGAATAIRFFKGGAEAGSGQQGRLWAEDGTVLADAQFAEQTESGWQVARLGSPVLLEAGKGYVVSYFAPRGRYSVTQGAFDGAVDGGWVNVPADAGVYRYGTDRDIPSKSYASSNYFVDILFAPIASAAAMDPVPAEPATDPAPAEPAPIREPGIYVWGNQLVDGTGRAVQLRGVNRSGTEYACIDGWGVFDGPADQSSIDAMKDWGINAVRVPLNSACWLDLEHQFSTRDASFAGSAYQGAISDYVELLTQNGIHSILDLHWTGCGDNACTANWLKPLPDRPYATDFWTSVAGTFRDNRWVLFDLFNEPQSVDWACWQSGGCTAFEGDANNEFIVEGMQPMVDAIREAGAQTQPILVGGLQYANDMTGWLGYLPDDPSDGLVASVHLYNFNHPCPKAVDPEGSAEGAIACFSGGGLNSIDAIAAEHPVVFGELGQDGCKRDFVDPMLDWIDDRGFGVLGWAWNTAGCAGFPALITAYDGTPTEFGEAFRDKFQQAGQSADGT